MVAALIDLGRRAYYLVCVFPLVICFSFVLEANGPGILGIPSFSDFCIFYNFK